MSEKIFQPQIFWTVPWKHHNNPLSLNHLIFPLFSHPTLDCLVDAHIHRLPQVNTSCRDVDYLNPKRLDLVDYFSHHVDVVGVKNESWDYTWRLCVFPWDEHEIDPLDHSLLIHPCLWLA